MIWQGVNQNIDDMVGVKSKFSQITGGKNTLNFVIWCHECPKSKNLQITRLKSKQFFLQKGKPEIVNITGVNIY